jgi:hypothetical protein
MPKYIKITLVNSKSGFFVSCKEIGNVVKNMYDDIEHIDTGDQVVFTVVEMSQEEFRRCGAKMFGEVARVSQRVRWAQCSMECMRRAIGEGQQGRK